MCEKREIGGSAPEGWGATEPCPPPFPPVLHSPPHCVPPPSPFPPPPSGIRSRSRPPSTSPTLCSPSSPFALCRHQEQEQAALHRAQLRGLAFLPPARPQQYPQAAPPNQMGGGGGGGGSGWDTGGGANPPPQQQQQQQQQGGANPGGPQQQGRGGTAGQRPSQHQFGNVDALGLDHRTVPRGLRPPQQQQRGGAGR